MVQVYKEELCRRHYNSVISLAFAFRAATLIAAIVLSLAIAFATDGFWIKLMPDTEQPTVHYTGQGLAILEGGSVGQEQIWTTSDAVQTLLRDKIVSAAVQVGEVDQNHDGKPDVIHFRAQVSSTAPVHSLKLLLQFQYSLKAATKLTMYSLAYITHSSPLPGAGFSGYGELAMHQLTPIPKNTFHTLYNRSILQSGTSDTVAVQMGSSLDLPRVLANYAERNITTTFNNHYPVWQAGNGDTFDIHVRIRIPASQVIIYRPPLGEMLKWGWVQFVCTFLAVWWVLARAERFVFHHRVVETRVLSDVQPRSQKF